MKYFLFLISILLGISCNNNAQSTGQPTAANQLLSSNIGGGCENCGAIYESPVPFEKMKAVDTLPDYNEAGPKIEISGTIYQPDGRTPAQGVVLYIYHTDQEGNYSLKGNERGATKQHGYIRGWVKTGADGHYKFYTLVPASYPNSNNPKHIHPIIKEADKKEYWIDEFIFNDDPLLAANDKNRPKPRGGSGLLKPVMQNGLLKANRNIILGLHVPGYPVAKKASLP